MKGNKHLMFWANTTSIKYINYHFTQLGEILDYLDKIFPNRIDCLDADVENLDNNFVLKQLITERYKSIALYVGTENVREVVNLTEIIKSILPDIKLIAYGPLPILIPKFFCSTNFDAVCSNGDVELSLSDFFKYVDKDLPENEMRGVSLIRDGELKDMAIGTFIDINDLGFPRIDRIPIESYQKLNKDKKINLTLSRGCPFTCPHCLVQITEGHTDRRRDIQKLKEYLLTIYPKYTEIKIFSPEFTLNKKYVNDFCDLIKIDFPDLKWDCATRVDLVKDIDLLKKMASSGCSQITLGVESLSSAELSTIGKHYNLIKVPEVIQQIKSTGIIVKACVIIGIPGQTKESLKLTLDVLTELGVIIRPMIYTRYQDLSDEMSINEIEDYNRKSFSTNTLGLSNLAFAKLLYCIEDYSAILRE